MTSHPPQRETGEQFHFLDPAPSREADNPGLFIVQCPKCRDTQACVPPRPDLRAVTSCERCRWMTVWPSKDISEAFAIERAWFQTAVKHVKQLQQEAAQLRKDIEAAKAAHDECEPWAEIAANRAKALAATTKDRDELRAETGRLEAAWSRWQRLWQESQAELAAANARAERLAYLLRIYIHAHKAGNGVPGFVEDEAEEAVAGLADPRLPTISVPILPVDLEAEKRIDELMAKQPKCTGQRIMNEDVPPLIHFSPCPVHPGARHPTPTTEPKESAAEHFKRCGPFCEHVAVCKGCANVYGLCERHKGDPDSSFSWPSAPPSQATEEKDEAFEKQWKDGGE